MRVMMGLLKDRHGTYYARHKVPLRLQEATARILENGKAKQVWLKRSLGTKKLQEAHVRAKPVQMEFDRIIARAEETVKARPMRTSLSDTEIKRMAEYTYAHALAAHDELRPLRGRSNGESLSLSLGCPGASCLMRAIIKLGLSLRQRRHWRGAT
jgi:hypothetical protein